MRGFGQSLKKQEEPYDVLNQTGSMLIWSHSFPACRICTQACLLLCAAWPLGELVGKFWFVFPSLLMIWCFVQHWYWDRGIRLEEGVPVKSCWQHCSATQDLKLEGSLFWVENTTVTFVANFSLMNVSDMLK